MRIMVVDDDASVRMLLQALLNDIAETLHISQMVKKP